ncbi:tol-pal system protein YbgF [Pelagibius sp. CAU 1746]|uniref:tol-pal system protein YbgF n=1 Tax=Pelagibius sp. CAU 1746 TaxID=3140370 RepID=UPI00325A4C34
MAGEVRSFPFTTTTSKMMSFARGAALALLLVMLAGPQPVLAQQSVDDQIQRLQRELSDLQRQVYGGEAPPAGAAASGGGLAPTQAARLQLQLDQFEVQMQELTGRVEDMGFRMQSVSDRLDKLVADVDLRLRNLEQGGLPPVGAQGQPQPQTPVAEGPQMAGGQGAALPQAGAAPPAPSQPGSIGSISESDLSSFQSRQASTTAQAQAQAQAQAAPAPGGQQQAAVPSGAGVLPEGTPQQQYDYAFGLLRQANYAGAEQAFAAFLVQHPDDALAGNAKYWLGETYYVRGNYQQAAVTFAEGFEAYPNNSKAPDNLLKLGMSLASLGSTQDACGTFGVLLDRYADAPATILSRAQRESQRLSCP